MKTIILISTLIISFSSFAKSIECTDSNKVKTFKFDLKESNQLTIVQENLKTKYFIKDINNYSEINDFVTISDLKTNKTITYSLICSDN